MSCISSPTATQYGVVTSDVVTTSFSESVTTIPGGVTTISTSVCSASTSGNVTTTVCTPTEIISTLSPTVITTEVPVPITDIITTSSPTATLFGSSCSDTGGTPVTPSSNSPSSSPSSSTPSSSSPSSSPTPTPTSSVIVISSSSTMPNGAITVVPVTSTVVVTPSPSTSTAAGGGVPIGAIVGGVVGGIAGLAILIFLLRFCFFRKKRMDDMGDIDAFYENKHLSRPDHNNGSAGLDGPRYSAYTGNPPVSPDATSSSGIAGNSTGVAGQSDVTSLNGGPSVISGSSAYSPNLPSPISQPVNGVGPGTPGTNPAYFNQGAAAYGPMAPSGMLPMAAIADPALHRRGPSVGSGDASAGGRASYYGGSGGMSSEGGSNLSSGGAPSVSSRTPLTVANPNPITGVSAYPQDVKPGTIYLNDTGYQVRGRQPVAESSTQPVVQHQDGGAVPQPQQSPPVPAPVPAPPQSVQQPQPEQAGPSARRPSVHPESDFDEHLANVTPTPRNRKGAEASEDHERQPEVPPPAYEE